MRAVAFTPLHVQMLLHYYAIATPYAENEPAHANSWAVREYREQLIRWGYLLRMEDRDSGYGPTQAGLNYIDRICKMA